MASVSSSTDNPPPTAQTGPARSAWTQPLELASAGVAAVGGLYILVFVLLSAIRSFYPYELEWIEGANLDEIHWIMAGNPVYGPPDIHYLPNAKTPLYFYLSAGLVKLVSGLPGVGMGFVAPRWLSICATLATLWLVFALIKRATGSAQAGLLAAGLYTATYRFTGAWMDLAKTDSLFLLLLLLAFWIGYRYPNWRAYLVSGIIFAFAYFTKQLTLPFALVLAPISLVSTRGRTWTQWLPAFSLGAIGVWLLNLLSDGWFSFYTFRTLLYHQRTSTVLDFLVSFLRVMWPAALLALWHVGSTLWAHRSPLSKLWQAPWQIYGLCLALLLTSWSISLKSWTYDNGFMPVCLGLAILVGYAYGRLRSSPARAQTDVARPHSTRWLSQHPMLPWLALLLVQFGLLAYNPLHQLSTSDNRLAAQSFVSYVSDLPGEVWIYQHGYFGYLAGKATYLHTAPLGDILGGRTPPPDSDDFRRRAQTSQVIAQALSDQIFNWLILDRSPESWYPYYVYVSDVPYKFYPLTGARTSPALLLARNPVLAGGSLPLSDPTYSNLFSEGWSAPQEWGRWVSGDRAQVKIALQPDQHYRLEIQAATDCQGTAASGLKVSVSWENHALGENILRTCEPAVLSFDLPAKYVTGKMDRLGIQLEPPLPDQAGLKITAISLTR